MSWRDKLNARKDLNIEGGEDKPSDTTKAELLTTFVNKWQDILFKDTGAQTTGEGSGFDKIHNITYGCKCEEAGKKCRCNE